jgi:hypothetical protein
MSYSFPSRWGRQYFNGFPHGEAASARSRKARRHYKRYMHKVERVRTTDISRNQRGMRAIVSRCQLETW